MVRGDPASRRVDAVAENSIVTGLFPAVRGVRDVWASHGGEGRREADEGPLPVCPQHGG